MLSPLTTLPLMHTLYNTQCFSVITCSKAGVNKISSVEQEELLPIHKLGRSYSHSGYLLGRKPNCDIVKLSQMQKHKAQGIRVFLRDQSLNGTWVNGAKFGRDKRKLLKNNDEIQLSRLGNRKFYRVLLPPMFEANKCEEVYALDRILGRGSYGCVYFATSRETGEKAAIKVLGKVQCLANPKLEHTIVMETCIMMSLKRHPLVTKIVRIFDEQRKLYIVLEYVSAGDLFDSVSQHKFLDEDTARFVFWQLLTAIKYLHGNDIVHRDLKPENVLLTDKEKLQVKIADFGLAAQLQRDESLTQQCGTLLYIAPEILAPSASRAYNKGCDLWSLGVMLYVCLCGVSPFSEENAPHSLKEQIRKGIFEFPAPIWNAISEEAKALVRGLLTIDPLERLTAEEALLSDWMGKNPEELERMKDGLGEEANRAIVDLRETELLSETQEVVEQ